MGGKIFFFPEEMQNMQVNSYREYNGDMNATPWLKFVQEKILERGHEAFYSYDKKSKLYLHLLVNSVWYQIDSRVVNQLIK